MQICGMINDSLEFRVIFVDIMCQINQEHKKNMRYANGQNVSYIFVVCAINGCIESSLQRYKLYSETLVEKCFELNTYDIYVSKQMVNGKKYIHV